MLAQQSRHAVRVERSNVADAFERQRQLSDEGQSRQRRVEVGVEPGQDVSALPRVLRPARRDDAERTAGDRLVCVRRMEDRRIDGVRDHDRVSERDPELGVLLEAVARLQNRRVRKLGVDLGDPRIRPVVEAAVRADRPVDAMHQPAVVAREPPEPGEVEVERVEEARAGTSRDPVRLDRETAALELAHERAEELMAAAGGRRLELVEDSRGRRGARRELSRSSSVCARLTATPAARRALRGIARASMERGR